MQDEKKNSANLWSSSFAFFFGDCMVMDRRYFSEKPD